MDAAPLLEVARLSAGFADSGQIVLDDVSLAVGRDETVGVVGSSGAGKTMLVRAIVGHLPRGARITEGSISFDGTVLVRDGVSVARPAGRMAMIVQDPVGALNPVRAIGRHMHRILADLGRRCSRSELATRLAAVGIHEPERVLDAYPHELSGGMAQRVLIATALALEPQLLLADEPTSALDVTTQAHIMQLLREQARERGVSLLLVTHDMGLVAEYCDRVAVVDDGRVIEQGHVDEILSRPVAAVTRRLVAASRPGTSTARGRRSADPAVAPLVRVDSVAKTFSGRGRPSVRALADVSLAIEAGSTLALVGESGSGKTTLGRCIVGLERWDTGSIDVCGHSVASLRGRAMRSFRREAQILFQAQLGAFNPRMRVLAVLEEPLHVSGVRSRAERRSQAIEGLTRVGLDARLLSRYPGELSGGQQQRVAIARAILSAPRLLVLDEPTSALDAPVRREIQTLLVELQRELHLTYLLISHDLAGVRSLSDHVAVMHRGRIVEYSRNEDIFTAPKHEYTAQLLAAMPRMPAAAGPTVHRVLTPDDALT